MSTDSSHSTEEPASHSSPRKKTGAGLYLIALFVAAFLLLILAHLMQQRGIAAQAAFSGAFPAGPVFRCFT